MVQGCVSIDFGMVEILTGIAAFQKAVSEVPNAWIGGRHYCNYKQRQVCFG